MPCHTTPCHRFAAQAKQLQDELTDVLCSSSASTATAEGVALGGVAGVGGVMAGCMGGGESNALSCSTRSSSVASEACGAIDITHEEGRNSAQGGGGAYLEVCSTISPVVVFFHFLLLLLFCVHYFDFSVCHTYFRVFFRVLFCNATNSLSTIFCFSRCFRVFSCFFFSLLIFLYCIHQMYVHCCCLPCRVLLTLVCFSFFLSLYLLA